MKTKISNILGVGLALLMVFSLAFALLPAKVEAAPSLWTPEVGPGTAGTNTVGAFDVNGMAVGPDGMTIYVADAQTPSILKSTNGGRTFAALANPGAGPLGAFTAPVRLIAVAPDNPNVVAVVDSLNAGAGFSDGQVYVSRDGGVNWVALPGVTGGAGGLNRVMDVAVGPARSAAAVLDGRDIAVATSFDTTVLQTSSDLFIIGQTLVWSAVGSVCAGASYYDYTSVAFSPGFIGDRVLIAVGSRGSAAVLGTAVMMINLGAAWGGGTAAFVNPPNAAVLIQAEPIDWDSTLAVATSIVSSDIALPTTGFDPTTPGGQRVWVAINATLPLTAPLGADVFRVDFLTVRKLGLAASANIFSISYSGDFNSGTLLAGAVVTTAPNFVQTWYTNDPTVAFPTWIGSAKAPTGTANAIVACAPDFPTSKKVFAGTSDGATAGNESAFSVSYNGGVSFNQISLIDTAINGMADVQVTPDGKTLFLSTWNAATGLSLESLWTAPAAPNGGSWDRIRTSPATWGALGGAIIRLNPAYASAPVIFWGDVGAVALQYSSDGGNVFVGRNTLPVAMTDIAVESATVIYAASGTTVYRSDSAAWNFNVGPVDPGIGPIYMLAMAPTYPLLPVAGNLLVGGAGAVANFSTNSANPGSFGPPAGTGLGAATNVTVVADTNYATNNIVYAGSATAAGIWRWVIGTSTIWEPIAAAPALTAGAGLVSGMVATNGALYAAWTTAGVAPSGADRTLNPTAPGGLVAFDLMNAGAAAPATFLAVPQTLKIDASPMPTLYAISTVGAGTLLAYLDNLATAKTTLSAPADGSTIAIDPVSGRATPVTLTWAPMGFGPGLTNTYEIQIAEQGTGFAAPVATNFYSPTGAAIVGPPAIAAHLAGLDATAPQLTMGPAGATWVVNLVAGHTYEWRVRAREEVGGDVVRSPWSAGSKFSIEAASGIISPPHAGPILTSPTPGDQTVDPGAAFSWAPMSGVTEYELIIATDAALTQPVAGTPATLNTSAYGPVTLEYDTDYYYAVRATAPTSSVQSIGAFHTMISPEEVAPPVVVEQPTISPAWIWAVVIIGALLVVAVLVLIVRTRRV